MNTCFWREAFPELLGGGYDSTKVVLDFIDMIYVNRKYKVTVFHL